MKQHGVLFTTENRIAVREDRKTQTRRIPDSFKDINDKPDDWIWVGWNMGWKKDRWCAFENKFTGSLYHVKIPWAVGDELYIKEPWAVEKRLDEFTPAMLNDFAYLHLFYKEHNKPNPLNKICGRWRSPRFMPKWAARNWLRITAVKVERLQSISEQDAVAGGQGGIGQAIIKSKEFGASMPGAIYQYAKLWNSINRKKHPWERNEWVVAYTFKRIKEMRV